MIRCPDRITVGKASYRINTDFDVWLEFLKSAKDFSDGGLRLEGYIEFIHDSIFVDRPKTLAVLREGISEQPTKLEMYALKCVLEPCFDFAKGYPEQKDSKGDGKKSKRVFDFEQDWKYIDLAFLKNGIDLYSAKLHWWRFLWLMQAVMSDELKEIIGFRSMPAAKLSKMTKSEKEYYNAKRAAYALTDDTQKAETADEHWRNMRDYIAKRRNEAQRQR